MSYQVSSFQPYILQLFLVQVVATTFGQLAISPTFTKLFSVELMQIREWEVA